MLFPYDENQLSCMAGAAEAVMYASGMNTRASPAHSPAAFIHSSSGSSS